MFWLKRFERNVVFLVEFMPNVNVINPVYNRSKLLKEAIESVSQQTYTDFELLVIDDGSTDDTRFVVEQIPDSRIKYYYKDNGEQSSARNLGIMRKLMYRCLFEQRPWFSD